MSERAIVTMSKLGRRGRFANQVFQYSYIRLHKMKTGCDIQINPLIGQFLFDHNDPPVTLSLTFMNESRGREVFNGKTSAIAGPESPPVNVDITGYFQYHTSFYRPYKKFFRSLFKPIPYVRDIVKKSIDVLRSRGNTVTELYYWLHRNREVDIVLAFGKSIVPIVDY